jgi:TP901 family phage tail tape measure protein
MAKGFNLTAEINLRGPSNIRQVVGNIRKQLGTINTNVNVKIDKNTAKQISVANKAFINFNKTLKQTQTLSNTTSASLSKLATSAQQLSTSLASAPQKINQVAQSANKIAKSNQQAAQQTQVLSSEFAEFGRQSALAVRRFAAFATVTGVIYKVSNAVTSATKDFLEFEKELIKVAQVSKISVGQLDFLTNNITRLSSGLGVASNDLIGVSRTLAQAGLSATDTSKALQALARSALAPTFDNMNRTVEGSIALMKQFGISANQLEGALGSINAVAGSFAVEAGDIITAISRAGGVFASASNGVSQGTDALNEFIAVFTSVRSTTRESAETIATGLRTIFTRIQRSDTIDSLKAFGVTLTDLEGKFVGPYKAIELLSKGLRTLDPRDLRFGRIVEELGGFRQIGKVIPLIQQFGTAQKALNVAQQGSGSLARDAAVAQQSLANQIAKVQEQFTALIRSIAGSDGFRDLTKGVLDIASALISVADAAKSALPALTAIFAIKGFQALTQFGGGFLGGIKKGGGSLNSGGYVRGYAKGGVVPGTGNTDTVPAMLTPGEFVIRKKAVADIGSEKLHSMNRYASGGVIKPNDSIGYVVAQQEVTPDTKSINKELTVGQLPKGVNFKGKKSLAPDDTFTIQADYRKLAVSSPKEAGFAGEQATSKALQSVDTFLNSGKGKTGFPKNPA